MYNEELKERYINYKEAAVTIAQDYLLRLFKSSEPYEKAKGKDICNFSALEIMEFYQMLNRTSIESLSVINSTLSQYTNWCQMQNLVTDNQNHFLEITRDKFSECVNVLYVEKSMMTRSQVIDLANQFDNYCDKFILLAFFEGLSGKNYQELWKAHYSDIDEEKQTMYLHTGRTVSVSKQLISYAYEAAQATEYYALGESRRETPFLESDDTIIKSYMNCRGDVSDHQMSRRIYNKFQRLVTYAGMEYLRPQNLIDSGKIHFINEKCKERGMSGKDYVMDRECRREVEEQYGCVIQRSNFVSRFGQFLVE